MKKCMQCQKTYQDKENYCLMCGQKLEKICPKCGVVVQEDAIFCGECGAKLQKPIPVKGVFAACFIGAAVIMGLEIGVYTYGWSWTKHSSEDDPIVESNEVDYEVARDFITEFPFHGRNSYALAGREEIYTDEEMANWMEEYGWKDYVNLYADADDPYAVSPKANNAGWKLSGLLVLQQHEKGDENNFEKSKDGSLCGCSAGISLRCQVNALDEIYENCKALLAEYYDWGYFDIQYDDTTTWSGYVGDDTIARVIKWTSEDEKGNTIAKVSISIADGVGPNLMGVFWKNLPLQRDGEILQYEPDSTDGQKKEIVQSEEKNTEDDIADYSDYTDEEETESEVTPDGAVSSLQAAYCPKDTTCYYYNGHTYAQFDYTMQQLEKDYHAWEQYCEGLGGHLATITSADENAAIYNMIQQEGLTLAFFGYSDEESEGDWQWITGEQSAYTNWVKGQPNNGSHDKNGHPQNYAQFSKQTKDGQWNDADIGDSTYHFICEWDTIVE